MVRKAFFHIVFSIIAASAAAGNIAAYFDYGVFNTPDKGPYIETYISVLGKSVSYEPVSGGFRASVEVSMLFKQGEDIKAARKYTIMGPVIQDTLKAVNFIDQQRIPLSDGKYDLALEISDKNKNAEPFSFSKQLEISFPPNAIAFSSIQLIENYKKAEHPGPLTKSGYDLTPYVSNFYPPSLNRIQFYCEAYNILPTLGDSQKVVFTYFIEAYETKVKLTNFGRFSIQPAGRVNVLLSELDIKELPSGNFNLVVEIKDKQNRPIAVEKIFFIRKNPKATLDLSDISARDISGTFVLGMNSTDSLSDFIRSLRPVSTESEKTYAENQLKGKDIKLLRQYFYNFWLVRDPANPELAWLKYYQEVLKVNKEFGTQTRKGYETDRGRVYLQYGPPNTRTVNNSEPTSYPYEIWQYYNLQEQGHRRFVFYTRDLVTNNYTLLHSDARGEIYNTRWEMDLKSRIYGSPDFNREQTAPDHFGNRALDDFRNPR